MMLLSFCEVVRDERTIIIICSEAIGDRLRLKIESIADMYLADRIEIWHEDFCIFAYSRYKTEVKISA